VQTSFVNSSVVAAVAALIVTAHAVLIAPAAAQANGTATAEAGGAAVARDFAELAAKIEPGDTVLVTRQAGERTRALVQGFDASLNTLYLTSDGTSFGLSESELSQLELRYADSRANGVVIGAVAGSSIFVIAGVACALVDGCNAASETFAAAALFGGIGAGIGFAIDSSIKTERLVYVGPASAPRGFGFAPVISRTKQGALVVFRF
jgi:hypothetical protein